MVVSSNRSSTMNRIVTMPSLCNAATTPRTGLLPLLPPFLPPVDLLEKSTWAPGIGIGHVFGVPVFGVLVTVRPLA